MRSTSVRWVFLTSVLLSVSLAGCSSGDSRGQHPNASSASPPQDLSPVQATGAPDGGKVRVAEEGISQIKDSHGSPMVSFGVVVESTSRNSIATGTKLSVTIMDVSGKQIKDTVENGRYKIYDTFPGHRAALGAQIHVGRSGAASIKVSISTSTWVPQAKDAAYSRIVVSDVNTRRNFDSWNAAFKLNLNSDYTRSVSGNDVNIIFHDKSGRLVGGAGGDLTQVCDSVPPGHSTCLTGTSYPLPSSAIDQQTEAYVSGN